MRKIIAFIILVTFISCKSQKTDSNMWVSNQGKQAKNDYSLAEYKQYDLNREMLTKQLSTCGDEKSEGQVIAIPNPQGELNEFIVWKSKVVNPALLEKYPNLQTYQGVSKETDAVRIRIENKNNGIKAIVLGGQDTWYINPAQDNTHIVFYKKAIPTEAKSYWSDQVLRENI